MYSILVVTLQTERGKKLTKEYEGNARQILAELHEYHTTSQMAQHEIVELTRSRELYRTTLLLATYIRFFVLCKRPVVLHMCTHALVLVVVQ